MMARKEMQCHKDLKCVPCSCRGPGKCKSVFGAAAGRKVLHFAYENSFVFPFSIVRFVCPALVFCCTYIAYLLCVRVCVWLFGLVADLPYAHVIRNYTARVSTIGFNALLFYHSSNPVYVNVVR